VTQLSVYFIIFLLLVTSFGLKRPSSEQYLQELKKMVHILSTSFTLKKTEVFYIYFIFIVPCIIIFYWN